MDAKETFLRHSEEELGSLRERLGELQSESRGASPELTIGYATQLEELEEKSRHAAERVQDLRDADAEDWPNLMDDVETALMDLKTALDVACTRF